MNQSRRSASIKETVRDRRLTPKEAAQYRRIRAQIEEEKPAIKARIRARTAASRYLAQVFADLRKVRQQKGLSLADVQELTGIDRSALSKLETGHRPNYTLETLLRYADAVDKQIRIEITDKPA